MTEDSNAEGSGESTTYDDPLTTAVTSAYKVLGLLEDSDGVGVLGQNDAESGTPIGVKGAVPNNAGGYGLETPDDLRVEGTVDTIAKFVVNVDGNTNASIEGQDSGGEAGNVIFGHDSNGTNAKGATIGGGGFDDGNTFDRNFAGGAFPTVGGGRNNEIGSIPNPNGNYGVIGGGRDNSIASNGTNTSYATVAGGRENTIETKSDDAVIAGGRNNTAQSTATYGVVGGGEDNTVSDFAGTIGGGTSNFVKSGFGTVGGGTGNTASGDGSTVGGGSGNTASGDRATVGGGIDNVSSGTEGTVGGGDKNTVTAEHATVGGGRNNEALSTGCTTGGGIRNTAGTSDSITGVTATVPGGRDNVAENYCSFAAGRQANARADSAFVWGDSSATDVESTTKDEVVFQAGGGMQVWSSSDFSSAVTLPSGANSWQNGSSRTIKTDVTPVDPRSVLEGVEDLTVSRWEYESQPGVDHLGPMAEEFHATFGLGEDEEHISSVDADGVAFAAIQGLSERLVETRSALEDAKAELATARDELNRKDGRIDRLESHRDAHRERIDRLETEVRRKDERIDDLEDRLATLEARARTAESPADD